MKLTLPKNNETWNFIKNSTFNQNIFKIIDGKLFFKINPTDTWWDTWIGYGERYFYQWCKKGKYHKKVNL